MSKACCKAHPLEQSQRAGDVAGDAELDSVPSCASARVEQDRQSAVVDSVSVAEVDHELLRVGRERVVNRAAEFGGVNRVSVAANDENRVLPDSALRDGEAAGAGAGMAATLTQRWLVAADVMLTRAAAPRLAVSVHTA